LSGRLMKLRTLVKGQRWINGLGGDGISLRQFAEKRKGLNWVMERCGTVGEPTIDWLDLEIYKMEEANDKRLLPVVRLDGTEYLVDVANRQFKEFQEPGKSVWFYSEKGRQMVRQCAEAGWQSFGLVR
jgi:hypothetical protein